MVAEFSPDITGAYPRGRALGVKTGTKISEGNTRMANEPQVEQVELRSISWWVSAIFGLLVGVTLTLLRTQRYFFIAGAVILAATILIIGLRTIRRRKQYPQLVSVNTSWVYALWAFILLVLTGPVQLVYIADEFHEIVLKSMILAVGFTLGIHEVDRALVKSAKDDTVSA